jgi:hypothetical protein
VLLRERVAVERGFKTGAAKIAFLQRRFEASVALPDPVLAALTRGGDAVGLNRDEPALVITEATLAETEFPTDRGRQLLPAWRLTAIDALGPIWVLEPDLSESEWQPAGSATAVPLPELRQPRHGSAGHIEAEPNDATVTLFFMAALPEYERYPEAEVIESTKALAIAPRAQDIGQSGARRLPSGGHQITVQLRSPIGARVVVDLHGHAVQVITPLPHS